jgi:hypothetical protein
MGPQSSCSAFPASWEFPQGRIRPSGASTEGTAKRADGPSQLDVDFAILKYFGEFGVLYPGPAGTRPAGTLGPAASRWSGAADDAGSTTRNAHRVGCLAMTLPLTLRTWSLNSHAMLAHPPS